MALRDSILAALVAAIWGFNFVVINLGLQSFPPFLFSFFRFSLAAVPAIFFIKRGNVPWNIVLIVGVLLGTVKYALLFLGMKIGMPAGLTSLAIQAQVIFTMILSAIFLHDRPSRRQWSGVLIAACGLILIGSGGQVGFTGAGFLCVIGAALAWAMANIVIKKSAVDNYRLMIWMSAVPPLPMLCMSAAFESGQAQATAQLLTPLALGAIVYTSLVATVFAFGLWGNLFKKYSANKVAPFALLVPVFGQLSAYLVMGERLTLSTCGAMVLIIIGLVLISNVKIRLAMQVAARS
jgi:O-acetylserine/cysteine efflux transporter